MQNKPTFSAFGKLPGKWNKFRQKCRTFFRFWFQVGAVARVTPLCSVHGLINWKWTQYHFNNVVELRWIQSRKRCLSPPVNMNTSTFPFWDDVLASLSTCFFWFHNTRAAIWLILCITRAVFYSLSSTIILLCFRIVVWHRLNHNDIRPGNVLQLSRKSSL